MVRLVEGKEPQQGLSNSAAEQHIMQIHRSQGSFEELVHGYVNKMKLDNKRTWADVLKRLEKECYSVIPRDQSEGCHAITDQNHPLRHYPARCGGPCEPNSFLPDGGIQLKWFTEFGHLNRGDMLTSEQHRCHNERNFSAEFKRESAQLVVDQNYTVADAASAMDVGLPQ